MKKLKIKLYKWVIRKVLNWSKQPGINVYDIIHEEYKKEVEANFEPFKGIRNHPKRRISDDLQNIDSGEFLNSSLEYTDISRFIKNN